MEVFRYKIVFVVIALSLNRVSDEKSTESTTEHNIATCPFTKIIEDIFKIHNKSSDSSYTSKDSERVKIFLNSITNITGNENTSNIDNQEDLVNKIIESINKIKHNITHNKNDSETNLNEAIILSIPKQNGSDAKNATKEEGLTKRVPIKSGIEDKIDITQTQIDNIKNKTATENNTTTTERINYVEILTIEPNNTNGNDTSSHNIIDVLKHLMPLFNSTLTKELHNITIIERNHHKNHSFTATKNVSTIVVTYCDKENLTKSNLSHIDSIMKIDKKKGESEDYYSDNSDYSDGNFDSAEYDDSKPDANVTGDENKDLIEAAEYGMKKMHELYTILEPKLYSMGLWLDDTNPARYVAAFNAPAEEAAKFSRFGYASLQAATRLKQLTSGNEDALEGRMELDQFPSASALRQSSLMQSCPFKGAPKCPPASKRYRTHDGTCNNFNRPRWGSTMTPVQRFQPPSYSDGLQAPRVSIFGTKLPSAREISALIHSSENAENSGITHLLMQWGQFLDHDITSSSQSRGFNGSVPRCCKDGGREFMPKELMHPECFPIAVPSSDPFYGPRGVRCLDFVRSSPAPRDGCELGWREQLNQVSGYIDASPLYASSARQSDKLRLFRNGMLQYGRVQQRRPLLPPERRDELCRGGALSADCFKSGDGRVNEHPGLVAAHIVWLRQHNRMAQELAHLNPHWSDEKIYQETRKIVGAMVQHITYREFLPIVLGGEVMRLFELEPLNKGYYKAYNPKINPSPASSFGSAAFRFGHSLVQSSMMRYDRFHRPINNNVSLHNELTNPSNIWSMGAVDRLLLGMVNQPIQKRDEFITEELTNHLFQTPHFDFGMDLAAINIQRGRDHGVPPYTTWREPCGLSQITGFEDLSRVMPKRVVRKFKSLYRHVDDIDLFTGGMAERPVVGGLVGPTFACIIAQQFTNLRKGDRFWYENGGFDSSFTPAQLQQIRRISFAQVLCRTLDTIDSIQPFVFLSHDNPDNDRISCQNGLLNNFDLSPWVEINSDLNNDISKSDDIPSSTTKPIKSKTTTIKPSATKKTQTLSAAASNKITQKRPPPLVNSTKAQNVTKQKPTTRLNKTDTTTKVKNNSTVTVNPNNTLSKSNVTQKIDDKLDFKNKSRRYDNSNNDLINTRKNQKGPEKTYDYDYDDDQEQIVHNVQTVVVNNLSHKRPYHRPTDFLTVTENVNKYTYLINYVPRSTESWRHTTRKPHDRNKDRDVIKVTYQTYGDTYRRPSKPHYYNKKDDQLDSRYEEFYRNNRPASQTTNRNQLHSSARSNGESILTTKATADQPLEKVSSSTENFYKLVTFGYVGTYKGDMTDHFQNNNETDILDLRHDVISQDFSTYETKKLDTINDDQTDNMKLSTFFLYETATRPYSNLHRPTRRHDVQDDQSRDNSNKYYYIKNVLHKYGDSDVIPTDKPIELKKDIIRENYNNPGVPYSVDIEERSAPGKMDLLDEIESKAVKVKKPNNEAKTPSVAFQIIPSENSPSQWKVYDEKTELSDGLPHRMPSIKADPYALKEIPRPMNLNRMRKRRPGKI